MILDLTDGEAALAAYENYEETYFASVRHIALSMGMDYTEDDFKEKLRDGLRFMIANEGVYLVHCKEGKDRTGFVVALLEFLLGATYEEAEADYMLTYRNYYGVTAGEERYDIIVSSNFEKILKRSFGVDEVKSADLAELAAGYIGSSGLTDEEISALKANLSAG